MSNPALKREMEDAVAAWPVAPALDLAQIANDNQHYTVATFNRYAKAATRDMELWQKQTLGLIGRFEAILEEALDDGDNDHIPLLISVMLPVIKNIEETMQEIASSLQPSSEVYVWLQLLESLGNEPMTNQGRKIEQEYRTLLLKRQQLHQECKERLMSVIWDHDPDTRGGPKFDKADDLIAFLEN